MTIHRRASAQSLAFYFFIAFVATAPAWIVKYPPLTDLPFHLATIRVVKSLHDPAFGLDEHFVLTLARTQYLLYYLVGAAISSIVGLVAANVLLVSFYLAGTVLGLRDLLRALKRDERLCLLVIPLLPNVLFSFGLLPFLVGIPLTLFALGASIRYFDEPTWKRAVLVAVLALAVFYSHIFTFGIFGLGFAALFPWSRPRDWIRAGAPTIPSLVALASWVTMTEAGKLTSGALKGEDARKPIATSLSEVPHWLGDIFRDESDEIMLVGLALVVLLAFGLSLGDRDKTPGRARMFVLVPIACAVLYLILPEGHGYIWLIAQRFPLLFLITAIPFVRMPSGFRGQLVTALALALALASTANVCRHFIRFQLDEVGDFDDALAVMEPKKKVCALIFDKSSAIVITPPFLHFGSYYQVRKGGVVMFTYAGYAHWPFDFKPGEYPPPGGPARMRWEWTPEQVSVQNEIAPYYDYVLTRGGNFAPPPGTFRLTYRGQKWAVWQKVH